MNHSVTNSTTRQRLALAVRGVVQGVGFRPFIYNAARSRGLAGWVRNETDLVRIEIEGVEAAVDGFLKALEQETPPQARIDSVEIERLDASRDETEVSFEILPSQAVASRRPAVPADLATCDECLAEIRDPEQRRHAYPFTNCTNCGPRWSIIEGLPYDRPRTSMRRFEMCPACRAEYKSPADRRFHAQPIACSKCGPELLLLDASGKVEARREDALRAAVEAIRNGRIVALKGLGGFQLLADATREGPVIRLRERKRRPAKPFAIMMETLDAVREHCRVCEEEAALLTSPAAPIVLLARRESEAAIAESVAPGNPELGVMLPYTPLHHLLMAELGRPVVCTSGNLSEEPMAVTTAEALDRLGHIADLVLTHNRPIVRPVDDSVVRRDAKGAVILRRARGYAPLPIELKDADPDGPTVLAVGGHLKNAVALRLGRQVVLGSHVGDLDSARSLDVHCRAIDDLVSFFDVRPDVIACDLHPDYVSTQHARRLSDRWGIPLYHVQHHHAHVAACVAEHGLTGPVLGLAFDGTGYGADGTVWGGEVLRCEGSLFERVGHLRQFSLPGGDHAVRHPRRSALGVLFEIDPELAERHAAEWFDEVQAKTLTAMLRRGARCPRTSSLGRLFDAVAALCDLPADGEALGHKMSFEGQAAMALQFAADDEAGETYAVQPGDWEPIVRGVLEDRAACVPVGRISARFHNTLADMALQWARRAGCAQVVLSGGCFQNQLLTDRVRHRLSDAGFNVYAHRKAPPGDGGIALGQAYLAGMTDINERRRLSKEEG